MLSRRRPLVFGGGVYAEAGGDYSSLLVLYCTVANNFVASEWYKQGMGTFMFVIPASDAVVF